MSVLSPALLAKFLIDGAATVAALVKEGRFDKSMFWVGMKGAGKYIKAIAEGDVCSEDDWLDRLSRHCATCESVQPDPADPSKRVGYCGEPLKDHTHDHSPPTCGCLVAGKCRVASERCPQRKWHAVPRVNLTVDRNAIEDRRPAWKGGTP